jgi:hypothetical protein
MKQHWIGFLLMLLAGACNSPNTTTTASGGAETPGGAGTFRFSSSAAASGIQNPADWCYQPFSAALVISPDPVNAQVRKITLEGPGVYKFSVDYGKLLASFMLRLTDTGAMELYTSNHFPMCLSNHVNFSIDADGHGFRYNNQMHIDFQVNFEPKGLGGELKIEFAPGMYYGVLARRCNACK